MRDLTVTWRLARPPPAQAGVRATISTLVASRVLCLTSGLAAAAASAAAAFGLAFALLRCNRVFALMCPRTLVRAQQAPRALVAFTRAGRAVVVGVTGRARPVVVSWTQGRLATIDLMRTRVGLVRVVANPRYFGEAWGGRVVCGTWLE